MLLTTEEVAKILRVTRQTLWIWRKEGKGPTWVRAGKRVLYPKRKLEEFLGYELEKVNGGQ